MIPPEAAPANEEPAETYPDLAAAGGLASGLVAAAALLGMAIGAPEPAWDGARLAVRIPAPLPGRADLTVRMSAGKRLFRVDNHEPGVANAWGQTADLAEVAKAAAAWFAGADPRGMREAAPFVRLPLVAEARATGSAQAVVEANWRAARELWALQAEFWPLDGPRSSVLAALLALFDAAYAQPRLRCLYALNSHYDLWFSQSADHPYRRVGAAISPRHDGRYLVRTRGAEGEFYDTPEAAATRTVELLPADCGPAILHPGAGPARDVPPPEGQAPERPSPDAPSARVSKV